MTDNLRQENLGCRSPNRRSGKRSRRPRDRMLGGGSLVSPSGPLHLRTSTPICVGEVCPAAGRETRPEYPFTTALRARHGSSSLSWLLATIPCCGQGSPTFAFTPYDDRNLLETPFAKRCALWSMVVSEQIDVPLENPLRRADLFARQKEPEAETGHWSLTM